MLGVPRRELVCVAAWGTVMTMFNATVLCMFLFLGFLGGAYGQVATKAEDPSSERSFQLLEETPSDTELPATQDGGTFEYSFSPKFEDLAKNDVVRFRNVAKYGITDNLEARARFEFYTGNPTRNNWDTNVSNAGVGLKYQFEEWPGFADIRSGTGFEFSFPIGSPSKKFVDEFGFISPFITFSRFLESYPQVLTFTNLGLNFVTNPPGRDKPKEERPDHSLNLTLGGIFYHTNALRYTGELLYRTTEIGGGGQNQVFLTPGINWDVPVKYTSYLYMPGLFQLSGGVQVPLTDEESNYRIFTKIKWNFDFGKFFR